MSNIEWTDRTWNPVVGCTPVSPGCLNCYAATMARRLEAMGKAGYAPRVEEVGERIPHFKGATTGDVRTRTVRIAEVRGGRAVFTGDVRLVPDRLAEPLSWRKPARVFVNSMSDLFHEAVPFAFVDRVFAVMALCPRHTFQVLTKRPERMAEYLARPELTKSNGPLWRVTVEMVAKLPKGVNTSNWNSTPGGATVPLWPLPNVWLGTSVEGQARSDERVPHLLRCPAAVRFLSCEPLLGAIPRLPLWLSPLVTGAMGEPEYVIRPAIDWVIVGGESGPRARACDVAWVRSVVKQCRAAGVPCFVKQLGSHVLCRNDKVEDWIEQCAARGVAMSLEDIDTDGVRMQGDPVRVRLADRKGGDPAEWPDDLRVREWPKGNNRA